MIRCLFSSTLLSSSFRCRRRSALFSFIVFASTFLYKLKQRGKINGGNRDLTMSHYHIHKYSQFKSAIVHFIVLQYSGHILLKLLKTGRYFSRIPAIHPPTVCTSKWARLNMLRRGWDPVQLGPSWTTCLRKWGWGSAHREGTGPCTKGRRTRPCTEGARTKTRALNRDPSPCIEEASTGVLHWGTGPGLCTLHMDIQPQL